MPTTSKTTTTEKVSEKAHEAVDKATDALGQAEERLRRTAEGAQSKSDDMIKRVTDYVHENPLTALGLAFAAGMLFSSMNRRH
jgi:ElaB/YqjD/DUF883 family membrane-anchored ribosome-binding protein